MKQKIQAILSQTPKGIIAHDSAWTPIHQIFQELRKNGIDYVIENTKYWNANNISRRPDTKTWFAYAQQGKNKIYFIINAHGAGTISDPLCKYDITAYCC